jgi:hypothetical protein
VLWKGTPKPLGRLDRAHRCSGGAKASPCRSAPERESTEPRRVRAHVGKEVNTLVDVGEVILTDVRGSSVFLRAPDCLQRLLNLHSRRGGHRASPAPKRALLARKARRRPETRRKGYQGVHLRRYRSAEEKTNRRKGGPRPSSCFA